jgi:CHAT domain-containing protein
LYNLAVNYQVQGDYLKAEPLARQSLRVTRDHLDATAAIQSERQQLRMAEHCSYRLDRFLSLALDAKRPPEKIAPFLLPAKGAVFVRQRRQRQFLELAGRGGKAARLAAELDQTSRRLAKVADIALNPAQREAWQKQLAELIESKERLEADLSRLSADFRAQKQCERLTPMQLRDVLPADTVLFDLVEYTHYRPDPREKGGFLTERRLLALVLRKGQPVGLVPLGPVQPIAEAIDQWRLTTKRTRSVRGDDDPALVLRKRLWLPLAEHLGGAKVVLISPDGATSRLPFAALPGSKADSYLIEEVPLAVIPVPQLLPELLDRKPDDASDPSLLLVGAVDYDAVPGTTAAGMVSLTGARSGERRRYGALEGTRTEIVAIKDSFEQSFPDGKVRVLRGGQATEAALREQAGKCRWLHLATHGFFASASVKAAGRGDDKTGLRESALVEERALIGYPPGLLSGLALAGANREPDPDHEDGILTALEVQALDLRKVDLAVLSACETGLGQTAGGEGLLGLQRAFQVAGARSVMASLWSVDDKATEQLMVRFYENRWEKKMGTLAALVEAQRWMLQEGLKRNVVRDELPEEKGQPVRTPPFYWAAFVLSGDWR